MTAVECIREGLRGSEFYTIAHFFDGESTLAGVTVLVACIMAGFTVLLGREHIRSLAKIENTSVQVKRWYLVLAGFPTVSAVQSCLDVVFPSVGIAFEVIYISYEALCLVCFAYLLLRLSPEPFEKYLDYLNVRDFIAEACSKSGHCSKDGEADPTAHLRYRIKFVYQMVVFAPMFALFRSLCEFANTPAANSLYPIFSLGVLFSTITAAFNILLLWCCILSQLPDAAKIHRKFFTVKGMVFVSNIQMIIVGLVMSCGGYNHLMYKDSVAQNVWSSLIFLVELPALQLFFEWAYPATDLTTLFLGPQLENSLLWPSGAGSGLGRASDADWGLQGPEHRISLT